MTLRIFNSGSERKEVFRTLKPNTAKIYVCGITPYDTTHLGHAFTYVSFDAFIRYLKFKGFRVEYAQNVTDIDDDILRKSREDHRNWRELGNFWTRQYLNDMRRINVLRPTHYIKATGSIRAMIKIIDSLLKKSIAYESGGNIYFRTKKFPRYGRLSHFNESQMLLLLKERGGNPDDKNKEDPLDFVLWQHKAEGEPSWSTPWGRGRPGWHIECSTMINEYLGERIDVHGGGRDLIFPHHESEIAQSESFTGKSPMSRYFMHTAMVMYRGEKMSKSLGNLIMVSKLLKNHTPNAIRWLLLSHRYRQVWEYVPEELEAAGKCVKRLESYAKEEGPSHASADKSTMNRFCRAMDDDLNTPEALRIIKNSYESAESKETVRSMMRILGFDI